MSKINIGSITESFEIYQKYTSTMYIHTLSIVDEMVVLV